MAGLSVASANIVDDHGTMLAQRGVDEIWELHLIGGFGRMARLSRQGRSGRLGIVLETLQGIREMLDDEAAFEAPAKTVTARSDLVALLVKMGFEEIADPPPYDLANRIDKHLLAAFLSVWLGTDRSGGPVSVRLVVMPIERFRGPVFRAALDAQISRIITDLDRQRARQASA
jgi:hypothetical protein